MMSRAQRLLLIYLLWEIHKPRVIQQITKSYGGGGATSIAGLLIKDHDLLDGLGDDDHTQYALLGGRLSDILAINTINEFTANAGVTLEGVLCKDGNLISGDIKQITCKELTGGTSMSMQMLGINFFAFIDELGQDWFDIDTANGIVTIYGTWANNLSFYLDSTYYIGADSVRPIMGYFDGIDVGAGGATTGVVIAARVDDKSDIGQTGKEFRDIYIDGSAYIDTLRVDVALNLDNIDLNATSVATVGGVIPVTVEGVTRYIPFYETYA